MIFCKVIQWPMVYFIFETSRNASDGLHRTDSPYAMMLSFLLWYKRQHLFYLRSPFLYNCHQAAAEHASQDQKDSKESQNGRQRILEKHDAA